MGKEGNGMNFIKGEAIRKHPQLKQSFFQLANKTFGLNFEQWDALGYWDESYCPYAFEENGEIVANVSTSSGTIILNGTHYQAVQIGTVMTNPAYQGKGLSRKLMENVLLDVAPEDIVYLFANSTVLDFYPKFGFETRQQATFSLATADLTLKPTEVKKLNIDDANERAFLYEMVSQRMPISDKMSVIHNEAIVMFHALENYQDCIYFVPKFQAIVIAKEAKNRLQIIDVITKSKVEIIEVVQSLPIQAQTIELCFTPDTLNIPVIQGILPDEGAMFVKTKNDVHYPNNVLYPFSGLA